MKRRSSRRQILALGLAVCAHLLVFMAVGWRIPWAPDLPSGPQDPPMLVTLLRPPRPPPAPVPRPTDARSPRPNPAASPPALSVLTQPAPAMPRAAPDSAVATSPPDCAMEDLPLLTAAERALCRVALDAQRERRIARGADEKAARQVDQAQRMPHAYRMDADKEASYAAIAHAQEQQNLGPPTVVDRTPTGLAGGSHIGVGVTCSHVNIPLLSGVETNPDLFEKKHKKERPSHGPSPCSAGIR